MSLFLRTFRSAPIVIALLGLASFGEAHAQSNGPTQLASKGERQPVIKTTTRNDFSVRVNVVLDAEYIDDVCRSVFADIANRAKAEGRTVLIQEPPQGHRQNSCSVWNEIEYRLDLYVVEPEYVDQIEAFGHIGHELWHGVRGLFHP